MNYRYLIATTCAMTIIVAFVRLDRPSARQPAQPTRAQKTLVQGQETASSDRQTPFLNPSRGLVSRTVRSTPPTRPQPSQFLSVVADDVQAIAESPRTTQDRLDADFDDQPRTADWASAAEANIADLTRTLDQAHGFQTGDIHCRSNRCRVEIEVSGDREAPATDAQLAAYAEQDYGLGCGSRVQWDVHSARPHQNALLHLTDCASTSP